MPPFLYYSIFWKSVNGKNLLYTAKKTHTIAASFCSLKAILLKLHKKGLERSRQKVKFCENQRIDSCCNSKWCVLKFQYRIYLISIRYKKYSKKEHDAWKDIFLEEYAKEEQEWSSLYNPLLLFISLSTAQSSRLAKAKPLETISFLCPWRLSSSWWMQPLDCSMGISGAKNVA